MGYLEAALFLQVLVLASLAGFGVLLFAIDRLSRHPKDRSALLASAGGIIGIGVGIGIYFGWHYPNISNPSANHYLMLALWGFAGFGWGGINTLIAAPFLKSPRENGWAGILLGCEMIGISIIAFVVYASTRAV